MKATTPSGRNKASHAPARSHGLSVSHNAKDRGESAGRNASVLIDLNDHETHGDASDDDFEKY